MSKNFVADAPLYLFACCYSRARTTGSLRVRRSSRLWRPVKDAPPTALRVDIDPLRSRCVARWRREVALRGACGSMTGLNACSGVGTGTSHSTDKGVPRGRPIPSSLPLVLGTAVEGCSDPDSVSSRLFDDNRLVLLPLRPRPLLFILLLLLRGRGLGSGSASSSSPSIKEFKSIFSTATFLKDRGYK